MNFVSLQLFEKYKIKMQDQVGDGTETSNRTVTCKRNGGDWV